MSRNVPVNVAIHDSLGGSPTIIEHEDPKILVQLFVDDLEEWRSLIVEEVNWMNPRP